VEKYEKTMGIQIENEQNKWDQNLKLLEKKDTMLKAKRPNPWYQDRAGLPGLDTTGLAALLSTLLVGLARHGRSSEHVGENEMSLLIDGEQANVLRGDDLKVRPTN